MSRKNYIPIAALLVVFVGIFAGIPAVRYTLALNRTASEPVYVPVVTQHPERRDMYDTVSYPGNLSPEGTITVLPKTAGTVEKIHTEEGRRVEKGQLLVSLDTEVVRLQMEQAYAGWQAAQAQYEKAKKGVRAEELKNAQASVEQAEKDLETARTNFERTKTLYQAGTIARAKFEETENAFHAAETKLENARRSVKLMEEGASDEELAMAKANADAMRKQYELAALQLEYAEIKSPVRGKVAKILVDEGNMVNQTKPVLAIVQDELILAKIPVPERHYGRFSLHEGEIPALIYPTAYPDHGAFAGRVTQIAPVIEPESRTFTVEVAAENGENLLKSGMYVNVTFILDKFSATLTLPETAVLSRNGKQSVFVLDRSAGTARLREVTGGIRKDGLIQLLTGVNETDPVIVQGNSFLEDGQKVRVVNADETD